jgi:16S rRNA (guanine527-N7)-methyltransferase
LSIEGAESGPPEQLPPGAVAVFGERLFLVVHYADWLVGAGVQRGLLGPREPGRIWTRHILNCAYVAPLFPRDARVVDVGSGAGLPGIPLAIARPDLQLSLVEPLERRAAFLTEVVAALGLPNCTVIRGRADEVTDRCGGSDVVTSRAVAPLAKLAGWCVPLLRSGGEFTALKGASAVDEVARDRAKLTALGLPDPRVQVIGVPDASGEPTTVVRATFVPPARRARANRRPPGR